MHSDFPATPALKATGLLFAASAYCLAEAFPAVARVGRAAEKLQDAAAEMAHVATVVEATSQPMARRDPLRKHMDLIYQEVSSCQDHPAPFARGTLGTELESPLPAEAALLKSALEEPYHVPEVSKCLESFTS